MRHHFAEMKIETQRLGLFYLCVGLIVEILPDAEFFFLVLRPPCTEANRVEPGFVLLLLDDDTGFLFLLLLLGADAPCGNNQHEGNSKKLVHVSSNKCWHCHMQLNAEKYTFPHKAERCFPNSYLSRRFHERKEDMPSLRIGTCSWKYPSWEGLVYSAPKDINYLEEYAT